MPHASITMSSQMKEETDDRRHSTVSRSQYAREAIAVRFLLESRGDFQGLLDEAEQNFDLPDLNEEQTAPK